MADQGQSGAGGGDSVGRIEATARLDTTMLDQDFARARTQFSAFAAHIDRTATTTSRLDAGMSAAGKGATSFGNRMLVVGQMVDDVQYGLSALVNQVPQFAMAFGMGAGVAGGLSIAAVAANQVVKRWDDIAAAFGQSKTLTEAERMEELGKQTKKTADEQERYNRYKREEKTIEDQSGRRPAAEGEVGKAVGAAVGEAGADELRAQITRRLLAAMPPISENRVNAEIGGLAALTSPEDKAKVQKRLEDARNKQAAEEARKLLANAETGPGQLGRDARRRLGEMLPGPAGDVFRDPRGDASETARLTVEGQAGEAAYDRKVIKDRMEAMGVEARHAAEEEAMARARRDEQDARDTADLVAEGKRGEAAFDRAQEIKGAMAGPLTVAGQIAQGDEQAQLDERMRRIGRRMAYLNAPEVRNSQIIGSADLNASVQRSISNDDPQARILEETKEMNREIKAISTRIANLGQPVRPGGK